MTDLAKVLVECVRSGTSCSERGKSAYIKRQTNEQILCIQTDHKCFRREFGLSKASDALFIVAEPNRRPRMVFVELKGKDIGTAARQLSETLKKCQTRLRSILGIGYPIEKDIRALVVRSGSSPKGQELRKIQARFQKETGVQLMVERKKADLRSLLPASSE